MVYRIRGVNVYTLTDNTYLQLSRNNLHSCTQILQYLIQYK